MTASRATYHSDLTEHLARYKQDVLGVTECGTWLNKPRGHILPPSLSDLSVVSSIRDQFWSYAGAVGLRAKLHRDFHHLTSSQAFSFNLFWVVKKDPNASDKMLELLGLPTQPVDWEFEVVLDRKERTNIDVLGTAQDHRHIYVEVKLSEREFGTCVMNPKRDEKRETTYRPNLSDKVPAKFLDNDLFEKNYQLLRILSLLSDGDRLALVVPKANSGTFKQAIDFRKEVLPPWQSAVYVIAADDLIDRLAGASSWSAGVMEEVKRKYSTNH